MLLAAMNNLGPLMPTLRHELRALNAINGSSLLLRLTTSGYELKALDAMNSLGLSMIETLHVMNSRLKMLSTAQGGE